MRVRGQPVSFFELREVVLRTHQPDLLLKLGVQLLDQFGRGDKVRGHYASRLLGLVVAVHFVEQIFYRSLFSNTAHRSAARCDRREYARCLPALRLFREPTGDISWALFQDGQQLSKALGVSEAALYSVQGNSRASASRSRCRAR